MVAAPTDPTGRAPGEGAAPDLSGASESLPQTPSTLAEAIGLDFDDLTLLRTALTHASYINEHPDEGGEPNERLEFLGDAVLGMIVADALYHRFPEVPEGRLTEWRAQLVCGPTLSKVAAGRLGLGRYLRLGRGEEATGGREREGNLERAYEAVVGAIYLAHGLETARRFVHDTLAEEIAALARSREALVVDPKGALQQLTQGGGGRPEYTLVAEEGPEHERWFSVQVQVEGELLGAGQGSSKQQAEKEAAREALERLQAREAGSVEAGDGETDGGGDGGDHEAG